VSTNINNPIGVPGFGGFPGGFGKKKREAARSVNNIDYFIVEFDCYLEHKNQPLSSL
jgi:hypothetical protein